MSEDSQVLETAKRLKRLVEQVEISRADKVLAERCMRRLTQPLRLTVFGTDPGHAISLINLMIGQPVVSPSISRARIQFVHGDVAHARVQFRDGSQKRVEGSEFRRLFEENPTRVRIAVDLPVLRKLSILVAAEDDPVALCADFDKTVPSADISLWSGATLSPQLIEAWESAPDRLRDHSYLVLSPKMDFANWKEIAQEFVEVIRVDPRAAQTAKDNPDGVDKVAFKETGGAHVVKTIKKEIDILQQSAMDASEVLILRYINDLKAIEAKERHNNRPTAPERAPPAAPKPQHAAPRPEAATPPRREQVYSVPLGKLASRSRLVNSPAAKVQATKAPRTVSMAIKNMPKNTSRPSPKVVRVRSRKSGQAPTPWSLGL
ncbi:MAG: hypothetical protein AAFY31_00285 [Pseudomonadota bacterium]